MDQCPTYLTETQPRDSDHRMFESLVYVAEAPCGLTRVHGAVVAVKSRMPSVSKFSGSSAPIQCHAWSSDRQSLALSHNSNLVQVYTKSRQRECLLILCFDDISALIAQLLTSFANKDCGARAATRTATGTGTIVTATQPFEIYTGTQWRAQDFFKGGRIQGRA